MDTDEVDELLEMSDPAGDLTARERRVAAKMVDQSMPARSRRRYFRPAAVGAIVAALLGGGVAAAAATGLWAPWAEDDALAVLHYKLPSGASCEMRIGNVQGAPDEVDDVIREALAGVEFDDAEVAQAAASIGVPGDALTDDEAYQDGYNWAVNLRIAEALTAHDLDGKWASLNGQVVC